VTAATFTLFRSGCPTKHYEYVGTVVTPEGRTYLIEARVAEHTDAGGEKRKHFEGEVYTAQTAPKALLRGARLDGSKEAVPQQVLELMEPLPFNDEIPA
jgi:hypothetical protein